MFNFCPKCASKKVNFEDGKAHRCPDCGFVLFHSTAAANGCLIVVPDASSEAERLVFLVRGRDPGAGKLDLPGGFVDAGEGMLEGLYRELKEELNWTPPIPQGGNLSDVFKLFASFSNVYEYKGIKYNTCDMFFSVRAPGLKPEDLKLEEDEVSAVRFLKPEEIDFSDIAFGSIAKAVKTYLKMPL